MRIIYTPTAISDLFELRRYITDTLYNSNAAERIVSHIMHDISNLAHMPYMGRALSSKIKRETDLRYIVCEKHLIFYQIGNDIIYIVRILDGRTDYIRQLF